MQRLSKGCDFATASFAVEPKVAQSEASDSDEELKAVEFALVPNPGPIYAGFDEIDTHIMNLYNETYLLSNNEPEQDPD